MKEGKRGGENGQTIKRTGKKNIIPSDEEEICENSNKADDKLEH